jgi:hypothetical protein
MALRLAPLGQGKLRDYVRITAQAGERVKSASAAIAGAGINRNAGFEAWALLLKTNAIKKHPGGGFDVA